eukprot:jgi/Tetstr1/446540/TSEL_034065.t1
MVCPAVPSNATQVQATCDTVCGGNGGNGKTLGRAIKSYGGSKRASGSPSSTTARPPNFHNGIIMQYDTPAHLTFLEDELACFVASGAWEFGTRRKWVSRLFIVPKPGVNQWGCIIDLRVLNSYCVRKRLKMETMLGVRHLTKKGDYIFSFDLQDGFYALGIAEADRDHFTVDVRALHLRQRLASLLDALRLQHNPTKGLWEPCQFGRHLGVDINSASGMFYAPADKLDRLSWQATRLIGRAMRNARWLPVRELQSRAMQARHLFLANPAARFFLRELHSVVGDRLEARGFWSSADKRQHITWKELKAVRLAVESFLPHLAGRNVLLHEDNQTVCHVLSGLTSRSPEMMAELRRLWCLLDSHGIHLSPRLWRDPLTHTPTFHALGALRLRKAHDGGSAAAAGGMSDLQGLHSQAKRLILSLRAGLERLEGMETVGGAPPGLSSDMRQKLADLVRTSQQMDSQWRMQVLNESAAKKNIWKRKVEQIGEETDTLRLALDRFAGREAARHREAADREELFRRARGGSEDEIADMASDHREEAAMASSIGNSKRVLEEAFTTGAAILTNMAGQRERLKATQRKMRGVLSSVGVSESLLKAIDRRQRWDAIIVYGGMLLVLLVFGLAWWFLRA